MVGGLFETKTKPSQSEDGAELGSRFLLVGWGVMAVKISCYEMNNYAFQLSLNCLN